MTEWAKPYVEKKWIFTAFKISAGRNDGAPVMQVLPILMSFATETPFYPYREPQFKPRPEDAKTPFNGRRLRVFFLADQKMQGRLGDRPWPGFVTWAGPSDTEYDLSKVETPLPDDARTNARYLTVFDDISSPRPGFDDVLFTPSLEQEPLYPRVRHERPTIWIPVDFLIVGIFLLTWGFLRWRFRRSASQVA